MSKVLIVDDIESIRQSLDEIIQSLGMDTLSAANGEAALDIFSKHSEEVSLIILDVEMPVMDGIEFLEMFEDFVHDIPVMICSARHQIDIIDEAISLGAVDYIMKPYDRNIIEDKLTNLELINAT